MDNPKNHRYATFTLHSSHVFLIELIPNTIFININLKSTTGGTLGLPPILYKSFTNSSMNLKSISKYLSLILRHKPEAIGITLDEHGWANVDELIAGMARTHACNRDILEEIVRTDEKQRYSFNEDKTLIRANQGHSIPVDVELEEAVTPEELWHGDRKSVV